MSSLSEPSWDLCPGHLESKVHWMKNTFLGSNLETRSSWKQRKQREKLQKEMSNEKKETEYIKNAKKLLAETYENYNQTLKTRKLMIINE